MESSISEVSRPLPRRSARADPPVRRDRGQRVHSGGSRSVKGQQEAGNDTESSDCGYQEKCQAADEIGLVAPQERGQVEYEDEDRGDHPYRAHITQAKDSLYKILVCCSVRCFFTHSQCNCPCSHSEPFVTVGCIFRIKHWCISK